MEKPLRPRPGRDRRFDPLDGSVVAQNGLGGADRAPTREVITPLDVKEYPLAQCFVSGFVGKLEGVVVASQIRRPRIFLRRTSPRSEFEKVQQLILVKGIHVRPNSPVVPSTKISYPPGLR